MMSKMHSTLKLGKGFVKIFVCLTSTIKRYSKLRKAFSLSKSFICSYKINKLKKIKQAKGDTNIELFLTYESNHESVSDTVTLWQGSECGREQDERELNDRMVTSQKRFCNGSMEE